MAVSMTGYGRSQTTEKSFSVTVEVKTVNHRFSEFQIRMPRQLLHLEEKIKKKMGDYIRRGRAEVFILLDGEGTIERKVQVDWTLLDQYYQSLIQMKERYGLESGLSVKDLVNDEIISIVEKEAGNEEIEKIVLAAVEEACNQLQEMRENEGLVLEKDLLNQLSHLNERVSSLKEYAPKVAQFYHERLAQRMTEWLNGKADETRILTEAAIFADKADINEELIRLDSHISQFRKFLHTYGPIGRKLDFLLQEMNREVNTIGSKANDSLIAAAVVDMKSLLEKMKEQVQNIE